MENIKSINAAKDLFYLIDCAINEKDPDAHRCAGMDLSEVLRLAKKHSLTVMSAYSLSKAMTLPYFYKEEKFKIIRRLALYDIEREKILSRFDSEGIWYLILKGPAIRDCYPQTVMREMSDNDILVDRNRMADVKGIMTSSGYRCEKYNILHHDVYKKTNITEFEMHRSLFDETASPVFYSYYDNVFERLIRKDSKKYEYLMTHEDMYIFLLCHMYKHYISEGTGIRSLLDIFLFERKYGSLMDSRYLKEEFEKLGISDFADTMSAFSGKVFSGADLTEEENELLMSFIQSTAHGTYRKLLETRFAREDIKNSKTRYVLKRVFPDEDYLKRCYPIVYKYRILYPFLVIYRPVRTLIKSRKSLKSEYRSLKRYKAKDKKQ